MTWFRELTLEAPRVRSLCWHEDSLVDWVGGGARYHLDGLVEQATVFYAYRFDAVAMSPSGRFAVIYERLGTKGLVLGGTREVREINRSYYHAHVYEYPVSLFQ